MSRRMQFVRLPLRDCRLLHVTATLQSGVVLTGNFPAPLDGVLASVLHRRRLGDRYGSDHDHHIEQLPLAATDCFGSEFGAQWVYAASCAQPSMTGHDVRWYHGRFDTLTSESVVDRLPANTTTGALKNERKPVVATVTPCLEWWAIGDGEQVEGILADVVSLGKRTGCGEGHVLCWSVSDGGDPDWEPIRWCDGHPARPFPVRAAAWLGLDPATTETVANQIRAPYWRPAQTVVSQGGFARMSREVVAPWTTRPSTPG